MRNPSPRINKTTPPKSNLCFHFQKNKCYKGENCHFSHSLVSNRDGVFKSKPCYWSFNGKHCPHNRCYFLHKEDKGVPIGARNSNLPITAKKDETRSEEYSVLRTTTTGNVLFYKTKLCEKWERFGWCGFGLKCTYAHGQAELDAHTKKLQVKSPSLSVEKIDQAESDAPPTKKLHLPQLETHTKKLYLPKLEPRTKKLQVKGHSWMGWSAEKIGRIYGDWIDSTMYVMQCSTS